VHLEVQVVRRALRVTGSAHEADDLACLDRAPFTAAVENAEGCA
jgi:hypothetical protein